MFLQMMKFREYNKIINRFITMIYILYFYNLNFKTK